MLALCLMLSETYFAQSYGGKIGLDLVWLYNFVRFNFWWISLGFLSVIIYKVSYAWCLRYIICSIWILDIRIVYSGSCIYTYYVWLDRWCVLNYTCGSDIYIMQECEEPVISHVSSFLKLLLSGQSPRWSQCHSELMHASQGIGVSCFLLVHIMIVLGMCVSLIAMQYI